MGCIPDAQPVQVRSPLFPARTPVSRFRSRGANGTSCRSHEWWHDRIIGHDREARRALICLGSRTPACSTWGRGQGERLELERRPTESGWSQAAAAA